MILRLFVGASLIFSSIGLNAQTEHTAFQIGLIHYTSQDLDEAIIALYDAVANDPSDPLVWFYRGLCREAIGEHSGALSDLNKALKLAPDNLSILVNRAEVLRTVGQRQRAINDLERVLYLSPSGPIAVEALYELGRMNIQQNSYREAIENYDMLIGITPDSPEPYYYRGLCRGHNGETTEAIADHSKALSIQPSYTAALTARAIQYILSEQSSLACDDLYTAKELGALNAQDLIDNFCE